MRFIPSIIPHSPPDKFARIQKMKKIIIFLTAVLAIYCTISFQRQSRREDAQNLILDAYDGDLIAVKNDAEEGAPFDFELYIQDDERQYQGVWFNALHAAASSGNEDVILFLLEEGFYIDARTPDQGWTPLMIAVRDGRAEAAKLLVYKGADLNAQSHLGATALIFAVTQPFPSEEERLSLITYLLNHGANPALQDTFGHTPLYYAQQTGKKEITKMLQSAENL